MAWTRKTTLFYAPEMLCSQRGADVSNMRTMKTSNGLLQVRKRSFTVSLLILEYTFKGMKKM
jgi:hypothetical protein